MLIEPMRKIVSSDMVQLSISQHCEWIQWFPSIFFSYPTIFFSIGSGIIWLIPIRLHFVHTFTISKWCAWAWAFHTKLYDPVLNKESLLLKSKCLTRNTMIFRPPSLHTIKPNNVWCGLTSLISMFERNRLRTKYTATNESYHSLFTLNNLIYRLQYLSFPLCWF